MSLCQHLSFIFVTVRIKFELKYNRQIFNLVDNDYYPDPNEVIIMATKKKTAKKTARKNAKTVTKKTTVTNRKKQVKKKIVLIRKKKATKKTKQPHGRPSMYLMEFDELVFKLCLLGCTDAELAETFGVAESTLNLWKKDYPAFSESLRRGKEHADGEVAYGMYRRAIGCTVPEAKVFFDSKRGKVVVHEMEKHYPPDPGAAMNWLKNRRGHDWKDVFTHTDKDGNLFALHIHHELPDT